MHCIEFSLISISAFVVVSVMLVYGNWTQFQVAFILFSVVVALSSAFLALAMFGQRSFQRWQIRVITLALVGGAGLAALSAFVILELQYAST